MTNEMIKVKVAISKKNQKNFERKLRFIFELFLTFYEFKNFNSKSNLALIHTKYFNELVHIYTG